MNSIVIDNVVVTKYSNGLKFVPIRFMKKRNPSFDENSLPKFTLGGRVEDNLLISELVEGTRKFEELLN